MFPKMSSVGSPRGRPSDCVVRRWPGGAAKRGLDGHVQVELHATIGSHPQVVDAVRLPSEVAFSTAIDGKIKSGAVQWDRFLAGNDSVHAHAEVPNSGEFKVHFVDLLARQCSILSHRFSPVC
jgi:hypothetical protein